MWLFCIQAKLGIMLNCLFCFGLHSHQEMMGLGQFIIRYVQNSIPLISGTVILYGSRARAWCQHGQEYLFALCWGRGPLTICPHSALNRFKKQILFHFKQTTVTLCLNIFFLLLQIVICICERIHFLKAQVSVIPPMFSGLKLAYFGVHVLGELQDCVHSRPGVRVLFQMSQHFLCHSLLQSKF